MEVVVLRVRARLPALGLVWQRASPARHSQRPIAMRRRPRGHTAPKSIGQRPSWADSVADFRLVANRVRSLTSLRALAPIGPDSAQCRRTRGRRRCSAPPRIEVARDRSVAGENIHVLALDLHAAVLGHEAAIERCSTGLPRHAIEFEDVERRAERDDATVDRHRAQWRDRLAQRPSPPREERPDPARRSRCVVPCVRTRSRSCSRAWRKLTVLPVVRVPLPWTQTAS